MKKIWIIARHEYVTNLRRPGFIIMTLIVPLLGALALGVAALFGGQAMSFLASQFSQGRGAIGVVDNYGAFMPLLPEFEAGFRSFADEPAGRQALLAEEIDALLVIPPEYIETGRVVILSPESSNQAAMLEDTNMLESFFISHLLRDHPDVVLRERLVDPINAELVSLAAGEDGGDLSGSFLTIMGAYFLGILLTVTIFVSSGYLLRSVSDEKSSRVIEIILSSVSPRQLLAGKVLGLGALGLTQVIVWLGSAFLLSAGAVAVIGVAMPLLARPEVFILGLVYYMLGFVLYAVLMGSVGALGTSMHESQQLAGIFSMMAAVPMFFGGFMLANPNMMLVRVLSWIPVTAPTMMLLRIPMADVPVIDIVISIAGLLLTIPLVLWAGAKLFRMGLLMYGKRPSLREVWRTLRTA